VSFDFSKGSTYAANMLSSMTWMYEYGQVNYNAKYDQTSVIVGAGGSYIEGSNNPGNGAYYRNYHNTTQYKTVCRCGQTVN